MPRIAGSSSHYELALLDGAGSPKGRAVLLPSVTTILKALPKGGLDWWGFKLGVKGTINHARQIGAVLNEGDLDVMTERVYEALKKERQFTPTSQLKKAGGRGTDVHDLAERLFEQGIESLPEPDDVEPEQHGYVQSLVKFHQYLQENFTIEVIAVEVPLFSLEHRFAGTCDLILEIRAKKGKGEPIYVVADFKTSKGIYESHLLQLPAYTTAAIEQGYIPADADVWQWVIRLGANGKYELRMSDCTITDFLAVKRVWEWLESMK